MDKGNSGVKAFLLSEKITWIVFLFTLLVTFFVWNNTNKALIRSQHVEFENRVLVVSNTILGRIHVYEHMLRGGAGLFSASSLVTRSDWKAYAKSLNVQEHYPGIQGIGFSKHIPAARLDAHLRSIRSEGFPDYTIRPAGVRAEYTSIIYLEPLDLRNKRAIGFDMFSEANRRAAMERARDTGGTALSAKVTLVQENGKKVQPGMLMYLPHYKNGAPRATLTERRANLVGYVYAPFRMVDLMTGILKKQESDVKIEADIDIEVYDGTLHTADSLLYDEDGTAHALGKSPAGSLTLVRQINLYGHTWKLHFTTLPAFHADFEQNKPLLILLYGTLASVLLSWMVWMLSKETIERKKAFQDLQNFKITQDWHSIISIADVQGNITEINSKFSDISGYSKEELLGKNHRILNSGYHPKAFFEEMWLNISRGKTWRGQVKNRKKDGSFYWVEASITPIMDEQGLPEKYISVRTDITQIKNIEEALRTSEQRLSHSQEAALIGNWEWNIQNGDLYWSDRIWLIFGQSKVTFKPTYENFLAAIHPEDRQKVVDAINYCVKNGTIYEIEHRCLWPDGTVRWMLERGNVIRNDDGTPLKMLGVVQDITERKLSESDLLRFKNVLDNTLDMIFMFEAETLRFAYLNHGAVLSMGYSREELLKMTPFQIKPLLTEPEFRQFIAPLISGEKSSIRFETLHRRKDGSDFPVDIFLQLVRQDNGHDLFVAIVQDITERKLSEAERTKEQTTKLAELNDILSSTPSCLKIINSKGELLDMNSQGLELIEAENLQCVYKASVYEIIEESHRANYIKFNQRICSGKKENLIFEIISLKGTRRWMETYSAPYRLPSGENAHISITNDITDSVKLKNEHERQKGIALHQAKLASLGEMSAGIAHEINNPLTIITGGLSILTKFKDNPEKVAAKIDAMEKATARIEKIINGLLKFSRTSEEVAIHKNEGLQKIITEVLVLTDIRSKKYSTPVISCADEGLSILCDVIEIEQVIINLINNAIDAVKNQPEKWVKLNCFAEAQYVVLQVMDSGPGISEAIELKLFEPFFTTKPVGEGTGLGLSITKGILEDHNATIKINRSFANTCFEIRFPKTEVI